MDDVVSYKCPNCAAGLAFDIDRQKLHCQFCGGDFSLQDVQSQEPEAPDAPAVDEPLQSTPDATYGDDATAFTCPSCGGHIVTDNNTAATFCVFCHNPTVIASRLDAEHRPVRLLPFKLKKDEVLTALTRHCKSRPLLPRDFKGYADKGEVTGLYVPYWLFDADVQASLRATGRRVTTWKDSNYRYTKTDTYRVERAGNMSFRGVPADASKKMDDKLMDALEPYNYTDMVDFSMQYLSGHFAESYDVPATEASQRAVPRMKRAAEGLLRGQVTGYTSVSVDSINISTRNNKSTYVMLPVWTLMAEYGGQHYTFAMNGQTGKITGSLPIDKGRAWKLFGIISGAVSLILFIGGMLV